MIQKLEELEAKYDELSHILADPEISTDYQKYQKHAKQRSEIEQIVQKFRQYRSVVRGIAETKEILDTESSAEMLTMAKDELDRLQKQKEELEEALRLMLVPKDPLDEKDVILEIRAGTGGEESA